jgi:hypothetical protein
VGPGLRRVATAFAVVAGTAGGVVSGGRVPAAAAPAAGPGDHIALVRQSPWVGPHPPNQNLTLDVRIQSSAPPSDLALSITVYQKLTSRSSFDQTLNGRTLGAVVAHSPALAVSALPKDASGVTRVTIAVRGDGAPGPAGAGNWTAELGCRPGSCANVYPVKVTLTDSAATGSTTGAGTEGAQLVTYLVYEDPSPASQPLRFALVVPLGLAPPTADRHGQVAPASASAVTSLEGLVGALGASPSVPVTLAPDPATLEHLATTGRGRIVSEAATLSTSPTRQTLSQSFVPVDAAGLVDAGLAGELSAQLHRAAQVLGSPGAGIRSTDGTWVASAPLDQASIDQLAPNDGHIVVPLNGVSGPTGPLTVSQPFAFSSGSSGSSAPTAMVSDAGLGAHLIAANGVDAALAAEQLLADLSLIYFEAPNLLGPGGTPAPRGVVAVAPPAWAPDPTFVTTALGGLQGNPVIRPVTLDQLFAQVPVGANNQPVARHPVQPAPPPAMPAHAVHVQRGRQAAFQSAAVGSGAGTATAQALNDVLLAAESSMLGPREQQAALSGHQAALERQVRGLSVRSDTIRLTAGTATVPITVLRDAPYPMTVVVRLTSDKLRFPRANSPTSGALCTTPQVQSSAGGSTFAALCTLNHATNAVYVRMQARASGDFRIDVALTSPQGALVLAGGHLTVRSMSTSAVAIALSVGAALVLLVWWGRTVWRGKPPRRGAHTVTRSRRVAT